MRHTREGIAYFYVIDGTLRCCKMGDQDRRGSIVAKNEGALSNRDFDGTEFVESAPKWGTSVVCSGITGFGRIACRAFQV